MCAQPAMQHSVRSATLADVLERVLDKGLVIAGDIKIKLVDIELLTIQIRLLVCSVEKACEIGMDWWRQTPPEALPHPYQAGTGSAAGAESSTRRFRGFADSTPATLPPRRGNADGSVASRSPGIPVGGIYREAMRRADMALSPCGGRGGSSQRRG